jgi:hypothetical protein
MKFTLIAEEETEQDLIDTLVQTVPDLFPKSLDITLSEGPRFRIPREISSDLTWNHFTEELTDEIADRVLGYFLGCSFRRVNHRNFVLNIRPLILGHKKPGEDLIILTHHHHTYLRPDKPRSYRRVGQGSNYKGMIYFSGEAFEDFAVVGMRRGNEKDEYGFPISGTSFTCDLRHLALQVVTHEMAHIILARALGNFVYLEDRGSESVYHCDEGRFDFDGPYCVMQPPPEMVEHYMWKHSHKFCEKCLSKLEEAAEKLETTYTLPSK